MAKNFGLGKGLGALISEYDSDLNAYNKDGELNKGVRELDISLIDPNPYQPRKNFDEASLKELAASISNHGVIQPIIVAVKGDRFSIVAGERRFRAARIAKIDKIPVIVTKMDEKQQKEVTIIENLQREDLNAIEEASGLKTLIDEFKMTQDQLAVRLGKSRPAITNALRLLSLPEFIQEMVSDNKISAGHARCLVSVKDPAKQRKLAMAAAENKLSVRQLELEVNSLIAQSKTILKSAKPSISKELKDFQDRIQRAFSTKVKISGDDKRGKIVIEYFNQDDLNRIYSMIVKK